MTTEQVLEKLQESFQSSMESMKLAQQEHGKKLETVIQLLQGNPIDRADDGLIGRVTAVEAGNKQVKNEIYKIKESRKKAAWTYAGFVVATGCCLAVMELILKLLKVI